MEEMTESLQLAGHISAVIYKNEENGYCVLRFADENDEEVTVVGTIPYASVGESLILNGNWVNHPVHGKQFQAEFAARIAPTTIPAIYDFLCGGSIKGIGPATAGLIVDHFGEQTMEILDHAPERLAEIRGISTKKAHEIGEAFGKQNSIRKLVEFICSFGIRSVLAMRLYKYYGSDAMQVVQDNPYIIATDHIGGTFAEADTIALEIGTESSSKNRVCAAALFELAYNTRNGHCFIPRPKLTAVTSELIGVEPDVVEACIDELIESYQIISEQIAGVNACYLPSLYEAESETAQILIAMVGRRFPDTADISSVISKLEKGKEIRYTPQQVKILQLALENQVLAITGGPGTGKTTSIRAVISMFESIGIKTLLTAPTGRAAKRMSELTGQEATTVHRLLGAKFAEDGETVVFERDAKNRLECDAVILDECSMVDISLMHALLTALPPDARLLLVGDADQLPSVGPGNVFSAVIRSQAIQVVRLTDIFRQKQGSRIIRNAHMINRGEHPDFGENAGDFFRLRRLQAGSSVDTIVELFMKRLPEKMGFAREDIQILSPTRKGELGILNLNKLLQKAVNPSRPGVNEKLFGDRVYREGDRVMQIRNNYDIVWRNEECTKVGMGIFNGDTGTILSIDTANESILIEFDGKIASYSFDSLNEIEHAWAVTVHKAQGSEYKAVIFALSESSQLLLTRDVLYTAVTRAKNLLIMVGDDRTAYKMIDNSKKTNRYTALRVRLRTLAGITG